MNISGLIASEAAKRKERMRDAVDKNRFHIQHQQTYRIGDKKVRMWEVRSTHTRRYPRVYLVSKTTAEDFVEWKCTCPDFEANGRWFPCKHILYVQDHGF